jgi:CheY-like chemotaxis protein
MDVNTLKPSFEGSPGQEFSRRFEGRAQKKRVLLLEDDPQSSETVALMLSSTHLEVVPALSGDQALAAARRSSFDMLLVDLCLPDIPGLEVVRRLRQQSILTPFIVITGFARPTAVVEAMKLGALTVLEKPLAGDALLETINLVLWPADHDSEPRSAVERWALYIRKAVQSESDPKTLDLWARTAGVSRSMLCESCRLVRIPPQDARDFARVLRAIWRSGNMWRPETDLDVADVRTLKKLERRAGLAGAHDSTASVLETFLERQDLIPGTNPALQAVRRLFNIGDRFSA